MYVYIIRMFIITNSLQRDRREREIRREREKTEITDDLKWTSNRIVS